MTIKVELTDEEVDYIAGLMLQWRIESKYKMLNVIRAKIGFPNIEVNEEDKEKLKNLFEELCAYELESVGINFAKKMLILNLEEQMKELQKG